jgi:hypothetical protein
MSLQNCPDCGAPLLPGADTCPQCGSFIYKGWTDINAHLPPASSTDPSRSIQVLICQARIDPAKGQAETTISAYYDFAAAEWKNDLYPNHTAYKGVINGTHWMLLPDLDSPLWIDASSRLPAMVTKPDGTSDTSAFVLTCDRNNEYSSSIIAAYQLSNNDYWISIMAMILRFGMDWKIDEQDKLTSVTHWMPMPVLPVDTNPYLNPEYHPELSSEVKTKSGFMFGIRSLFKKG